MGSFLDKLLLGIKQVDWNGVQLPQRPIINFIGNPLVLDNPTLGSTDVYSGGGSGSGAGILALQSGGASVPFEPILNFVGFTLTDDPSHTRTNLTFATPFTTVQGGTGRATLSAHSVLLGEGTSPVGQAGPGILGSVFQGQGGSADPAFSSWTMASPGPDGQVLTASAGQWISAPATGGGGSSVPIPPAILTTNFTPSAAQTYLLTQGNLTIDVQHWTTGVEAVIGTRGTNGSATDPAVNPVNIVNGASSFVFETPDDRSQLTTSATATLNLNGVDYRFVLDTTPGTPVLRCRGVA